MLAGSYLVASTSADAFTAPAGEVYVADYGSGAVSQFGTNSTGVATALPYPTVPAGTRPSHLVLSPNGKYAYALDCSSGDVWQYTVDTTGLLTGSLVPMTPAGSFFGGCLAGPTQPQGHTLAENKTGTFVLVAAVLGGTLNTLLSFKVGTTGALTQAGFAEISSLSVNSVVIGPSGKFAYVGDPNGLIFEYALDTKGKLTLKSSFSSSNCLTDVAINPSGKNLYATNNCSNTVNEFTVNTTTGALTPAGSVGAGAGASSIVIAPNAKTAYVTNATANSVSQYKMATTGLLTSLSPASVAVGGKPLGAAVSPTSKNLYVTNHTSASISVFAINATSLLLTPMGSVFAGLNPWGIAVRR